MRCWPVRCVISHQCTALLGSEIVICHVIVKTVSEPVSQLCIHEQRTWQNKTAPPLNRVLMVVTLPVYSQPGVMVYRRMSQR